VIDIKVKIKQSELVKGISIVQKAISDKFVAENLKGILIVADNNVVRLTGNSEGICIETDLEAEVIETGEIVINSKLLYDIVHRIKDEDIEITAYKEQIFKEKEIVDERFFAKLECKNKDIKLYGYNANEYPKTPTFTEDYIVEIKESDLRRMINLTSFVAVKEQDNILNKECELMEFTNNMMIMVATDGPRIAVYKQQIESEINTKMRSLMTGKWLNEIKKLLSSSGEVDIRIVIDKQNVVFMNEKTRLDREKNEKLTEIIKVLNKDKKD